MLAAVTRWPVSLLRPLDGAADPRVVRAANDAGFTTWLWTIDATGSRTEVETRVLDELAPGSVVRIAEDGGVLPDLECLVRGAHERGYRFLALPAPRALPLAPAGIAGVAAVAGR